MAKEIERKFLVKPGWRPEGAGDYIAQGYLARSGRAVVRVRIRGERSFLTVKSSTNGVTRQEYEYEVPLADGEALLQLCEGPVIEKHRHLLPAGDGQHTWEVDVFHGANEGLIVAEIELASEEEPFPHPEWLSEEVSSDPRYFNCNLAEHPYREWQQ